MYVPAVLSVLGQLCPEVYEPEPAPVEEFEVVAVVLACAGRAAISPTTTAIAAIVARDIDRLPSLPA